MPVQIETLRIQEKVQQEQRRQRSAPRLVYIRTSIEDLDYPIVPFSVLERDPIVDFHRHLKARLSEARQQYMDMEALYDAWNDLFAELAPEQDFFLYAWSSVPGVLSRQWRMTGLTFVIATPGPSYTRWVTTRPLWRKGELVAWSVPVDMHPGAQDRAEEIVLSHECMIQLTPTPRLPGSPSNELSWLL